jgi:hypothetical protein
LEAAGNRRSVVHKVAEPHLCRHSEQPDSPRRVTAEMYAVPEAVQSSVARPCDFFLSQGWETRKPNQPRSSGAKRSGVEEPAFRFSVAKVRKHAARPFQLALGASKRSKGAAMQLRIPPARSACSTAMGKARGPCPVIFVRGAGDRYIGLLGFRQPLKITIAGFPVWLYLCCKFPSHSGGF